MNTYVTLSDFCLRHQILRSYRDEPIEVFRYVERPSEFLGEIVEVYSRTRPDVYITSFVEEVPVIYRGHKRLVKRVTYIFKYQSSRYLDCKFMYHLL